MSSKFHNKFHRHNHHTTPVPDPRYPDAAHDPIASQLAPFLGTFWLSSGDIQIVNGEIYTQSGNSVQWSLATSDSVTTVLGIINSLFLPLTGGTVDGSLNVTGLTRAYGGMQITNNLTVFGDISATGNSYFANTVYTTTSALSVVNLASNGPAFYVGNNGSGDLASFYDLDTGTEVFHIGGQNGSYPNIGVKTSTPNEALTVNGSISARNDIKTSGVIYTDGGNSTLWNAARTNVWENSATWNIGANASTNVRDNSGNWIFNNGNTFAGDMTIGTNDNYKVVLETNNSPRLTIDTSGNVGIGTAITSSAQTTIFKSGGGNALYLNGTGFSTTPTSIIASTYDSGWANGAPATIQFIDDGTFGNHIAFRTKITGASTNADTERMRITTSGNVGIGVTSPVTNSRLDISGGGLNIAATGNTSPLDASLHIKSSFGGADRMTQIQPSAASKPALNLMASTDSSNNLQWWSWGVDSNVWKIQPNTSFTGSNGLFINSSGNVGIGTGSTLSYKLDINGDANVRTGYKLLSAGQDVITIVQSAAAAAGGVGGNGDAGYVTKWSGTGTVANSVAYDDGSNIGIGTTIPGTKLDVAGNARITASGQTLALAGTDHTYIGWYPNGYASGRKSYLGFGGVNDNRFYIHNEVTDGTGHIILDPGTNANVGIGETVPGVKLDVKGTCAVDYLRVDASDTVNEGGEIQLVGAGSNGSVQIDNHAGNVRIHTLGTNNYFQILGGAGSTAFRVEHGTAFIGNLPTGSTNSVVIENSNILQRRTINPSVWSSGEACLCRARAIVKKARSTDRTFTGTYVASNTNNIATLTLNGTNHGFSVGHVFYCSSATAPGFTTYMCTVTNVADADNFTAITEWAGSTVTSPASLSVTVTYIDVLKSNERMGIASIITDPTNVGSSIGASYYINFKETLLDGYSVHATGLMYGKVATVRAIEILSPLVGGPSSYVFDSRDNGITGLGSSTSDRVYYNSSVDTAITLGFTSGGTFSLAPGDFLYMPANQVSQSSGVIYDGYQNPKCARILLYQQLTNATTTVDATYRIGHPETGFTVSVFGS